MISRSLKGFRIRSGLLAMLIAFFCVDVSAQTESFYTKPQIASPNVAAFLRYGEYNVGVNTGVPDIRVPLFSVESGNISYGVDIDYNGSGIKVAQVASSVGLAWSLNASGMISRTVRSLPDEYKDYGYIDLNKGYIEKFSFTSDLDKQKYADLEYDNEPDIFSFRLPTGESGKFLYNLEEQRFINDFNPSFKVEWVNRTSFLSSSFLITTADGTKYQFEQTQLYFDDTAWEIPPSLKRYLQSWFLTKIENVKGDVLNYQWEIVSANALLPSGNSVQPEWLAQKSYLKKYLYNRDPKDSDLNLFPPIKYSENITYYTTVEPRLKQIDSKQGKVVFNYNVARYDFPGHQLNSIDIYSKQELINRVRFSYGYFQTANPVYQYDYRLKLDSLFVGLSSDQKYTFGYNSSVALPATNSTAQDYWGYYNGIVSDYLPKIKPPSLPGINTNDYVGGSDRSVNTSLIQAGMLKEVVYPTGGKTVFTFEPNYYTGITNQTTTGTFAQLKVIGNSKQVPVIDTVDFVLNRSIAPNTGYLKIYFSPLQQPSPYHDPPDMQVVKLIDLTMNQTVLHVKRTKTYTQPETVNGQIFLTNGHTYRLITTVIDAATASLPDASYVQAYVVGDYTAQVSQKLYVDGLRIKELSNYDRQNTLVNKDGFEYGSGTVLRDLREVDNNVFYEKWKITWECSSLSDCQCFYDRNYAVYVGQPNILGPNLSGRHIYYEYVEKVQYNGANIRLGKTGYSRAINRSVPYRYYYPNGPYEAEFVNNISIIGSLPSETYFRWDATGNRFIRQRAVQREYSFRNNTFEMIKYYRKEIYERAYCAMAVLAANSNLFSLSLFKISLPQYWLTREIITDYDVSGENILLSSSTEMEYGSLYGELKKKTAYGSDGKKVENYFVYPYDYSSNTTWLTKLLEKNIIGNPIESIQVREDNSIKRIVSGRYTSFDNSGRLNAVYGLNFSTGELNASEFKLSNRSLGLLPPNGTTGSFQPDTRYEKRVECISYDSYNNVQEIRENETLTTTYIWGYKGQYPVIKIENATYAEAVAALGGTGSATAAMTALNADNVSDAVINGYAQTIRLNLKKSQVSSYTYKPLVGMTSMTDARGIRETYEYDGFQRLKSVLDFDSNILRNYRYNYKP
ncbi:hypothetical protein [Sphingobacterium sp. LRF_L2]|uniref:hypothetical protein n=1 Tax=Sphingobacterium sp. LRF_L2 TaxID=3369421 RepID=UPI003F600C28